MDLTTDLTTDLPLLPTDLVTVPGKAANFAATPHGTMDMETDATGTGMCKDVGAMRP